MTQLLTLTVALCMAVTRRDSDRGASAVEYAIIVALIAGVIIGIVAVFGLTVGDAFGTVDRDCLGDPSSC